MDERLIRKIEINLMAKPLLSLFACLALLTIIYPGSLSGQMFDFNSGSTGSNGVFPPSAVPAGTTNITINLNNGEVTFLPDGTVTTLPNTPAAGFVDGIFNFTTVNLPSAITMSFIRHVNNPPITILAAGDITIDGVIDISGKEGEPFTSSGLISKGGEGGPGGFDGGNGGAIGVTNNVGSGGLGSGGGIPGTSSRRTGGGVYGAASDFIALIPLFGGSGGGGGIGDSSLTGAGGGGGGGAILLASSSAIALNGLINAKGGKGGDCKGNPNTPSIGTGGGGGSGGAIRLVATTISGTGSLTATGGDVRHGGCADFGSAGRIRLEAFVQTFSGSTSSSPSVTISPGPVAATSNPALAGLPELTISSVGGTNAPASTTGNLSIPDLSLPQGTTNPLDVVLTTSNIPVGTIFTVRVSPQFGDPVDVSSTASVATGNPGEASATAQINLPVGEIVMLSAFADFSLQTASLFPLINGEKIDRVMVAANFGEKSKLTFFTKSGKIISEEKR